MLVVLFFLGWVRVDGGKGKKSNTVDDPWSNNTSVVPSIFGNGYWDQRRLNGWRKDCILYKTGCAHRGNIFLFFLSADKIPLLCFVCWTLEARRALISRVWMEQGLCNGLQCAQVTCFMWHGSLVLFQALILRFNNSISSGVLRCCKMMS